MKLLRLILQGFKSFADKTTIEFADGMTVIVGPNGCGKSNISDAVRWVLGEQNVRNLRGQKSEDIIFAGSESRTRKNGAEVTLVLDNSNRELPLDTAEVSITRRILRNGDSDFQINKRNCRLKDIHELLANTGLGKGSLAIIGQNRVDEVLTAKPEERRAIFEDVAGISLYRMRKNEGLQKLVKTAENMDRVKDMMAMLDEQTGPMKEKAEKAKAYKALAAEKRAVQATMSALKLDSIKESLEKHKAETETLEQDSVKWKAELTKAAAALAKLEQETLLHQEKVKKAGTDFAEAKEKLDGIRVFLDIDIDYYALINMHGMIDLVDAVGGIEVTNHFDFPISIAENEPEFQAKVEPGTHKINGEQALVYSRMRYDDPDGDYGRQKRQREVIQKIVAKLLKMDSIGSYKKILSAVSSNVQTSINLGDSTTLRGLMGYSEALKNIKSYQLAGSDAMINGGSYQVASTEDILKVQNRIKKEVGKKGVSESKLKTSLVLNDFGTSSYVSDDFVNSTGSYEAGPSEATGGGSVSTYYGGTTYGNSYTENTSNYVQDQATTAPTINYNGSGVTTYNLVPAAQ